MLKKFAVRSYKNFKEDIVIDFQNISGYQFSTDCITDKMISKMLIYGRNATGKTNLGKALMDIRGILFGKPSFLQEGVFLNADSAEDAASFSYEFQFGSHELIYNYALFSDMDLKSEELIIDRRKIFQCDFFNYKFDFGNLEYVEAETANIERYLQSLEKSSGTEEADTMKLPFLRWVIFNVALRADSLLLEFADYVRKMNMITLKNDEAYKKRERNESFFEQLENLSELNDFEEFLNAMGVKCRLALKRLPDGQRELYFAHKRLIPFYENASSGSKRSRRIDDYRHGAA